MPSPLNRQTTAPRAEKMDLLQYYLADLKRQGFKRDPAQEKAIHYLQALLTHLTDTAQHYSRHWIIRRLCPGGRSKPRGIYLWGGVGRGKSYLMDNFYHCLPFEDKLRTHFYRFMRAIHEQLRTLKNREDPLKIVAQDLVKRFRVICLDEFHVSDIADAMLLAGLLKALFDGGVALVTTSNQRPEQLYHDGLQRERFLPTIALFRQHTDVIHIDSGVDYRSQFLDKAEIYHSPLDQRAEAMLAINFAHITSDTGEADHILHINDRPIRTVRCTDRVAWFEFDALCGESRGAIDYIELGRCFQTVLIANIPILSAQDDHKAKRLMILVDEFYDRNVKLIITAASLPAQLYQGERLQASFQRTVSRLEEMGGHAYLRKPHLAYH